MTRSKIIVSALAVFLVVLFSIYWIAAAPRELLADPGKDQPDNTAGITKDSIPELKKNLWAAQSYQEINQVIDSLRSLPGPNAEAAGVLLEYLKEDNRDDVWRISDALINLMTGDQVARLAGEMALYPEANIGRYLIPVLAARIDDEQSLTNAIISLQKMTGPGFYRQIMERAWGKIFTETGDTARWLDDIHAGLTDPRGMENLVLAVTLITRKQLTGDRRLEVINWLWKIQILDLVWSDDLGHSDSRLFRREWRWDRVPAGDLPAGGTSTNRHLFGFPGRIFSMGGYFSNHLLRTRL